MTRIVEPRQVELRLGLELAFGEIEVTEQVVGYERKTISGQERLELVALDLPPATFATEAVWFLPEPDQLAGLDEMPKLLGTLHAAEHALIALLPLWAMCDRWDIGGLSTNLHPETGRPTVFVYDGHPGGVGITERGFEQFEGWVRDTAALIRGCPCQDGCPSCVQSPKCGNLNESLDKHGRAHLPRAASMRAARPAPARGPGPPRLPRRARGRSSRRSSSSTATHSGVTSNVPAFVAEALSHLRSPSWIVGHSWGGYLALQVAAARAGARAGSRARRIARRRRRRRLGGGWGAARRAADRRRARAARASRTGQTGSRSSGRHISRAASSRRRTPAGAPIQRCWRRSTRGCRSTDPSSPRRSQASTARSSRARHLRPHPARAGRGDGGAPARGASSAVLDGIGHFPWLERPGVVHDAVVDFLASRSS